MITTDQWYEQLNESQKPRLLELRELILAGQAQIQETMKWNRPCYSLNSMVCFVQKYTSHVAIGFLQGAYLNDPGELLLGVGARMRLVRMDFEVPINRPAIAHLLHQAVLLDRDLSTC